MLTILLVQGALAASPLWNLAPFGVGVYLHGRPGRGVAYSATQAAGVGAVIAGEVMRAKAVDAEDDAGVKTADAIVTTGVVLGLASYVTALVDGGRLHELEVDRAKASVQAWDAARALASAEGAR